MKKSMLGLIILAAMLVALGWLLIDSVGVWLLVAAAAVAAALLVQVLRDRKTDK